MDEIQFLKFEDWQKELSRDRLKDPWITVFDFHKEEKGDYSIFCGLVPNKKDFIEKVLGHFDWDIKIGYGHPGFWKEGLDGAIHYERFGGIRREIPFEPLVIYRSFHGLREEYVEISEEFRLYHNLYYDSRKSEFIFLSESGEEDTAAKIEKTGNNLRVQIKTKYLRDFLAAKSMVLVRFHDHRRFLENDLTNILGTNIISIKKVKENFCFNIIVNPKPDSLLSDKKCFSRFLGKDIFPPFSEPIHEDYKFLKGKEEEKYVDFIIGVDDEGNPIEYKCNPDKLSNFFGANPESPNYQTPVFFKREVLKKYYDQPSKYSVEDNYIRCGDLWGMSYGQNPLGLVHAWLGDLGNLPYNEQLQWRQFNVPPEGGIGEATIRRELLAEFADPDEITHIFKYEFDRFSRYWRSKFGWNLFLPLRKEDIHFFESLHVPTSEEHLEFERQILALAKILPDSINNSELEKLFKTSEAEKGSINTLEKALISHFKVEETKAKELLQPLRTIQDLRSSGVVHRKGSKYKKVAKSLALHEESYINFFRKILEDVVGMLKQLQKVADNV